MAALPLKNNACVSLCVLSDNNRQRADLLTHFNDPTISVGFGSEVASSENLASLIQNDVVVFMLEDREAEHSFKRIKSLKIEKPDLKILVLDPASNVERAVQSMKIGASDYIEYKSDDVANCALRIEQACLDTLFDIPKLSKRITRAQPIELLGLHRKVQKVVRAAKVLSSCTTLQDVCENLLEAVGDALGASGGSLYLRDEDILKRAHSLDPGHAPAHLNLPLQKGSLFEQVFSSKEPLIISEGNEIPRDYASGWHGYQGESVLIYPLVERNGDLIGLFSLHGKKTDMFTKDDRDLVLVLAAYSLETIRALLVQERLKKAFRSLRMTFDNMNEGIILLDEQCCVAQFNKNVLKLLKLNEADFCDGLAIEDIYKTLFERGDTTNRHKDECPWGQISGEYSYEHYCMDGAVIKLSGKSLDRGGYVLTITDITEQKNWETELCLAKDKAEAANASKSNFLANISHELRTPLNAIIGFSEMMRSEVYGALPNEKYTEYVGHINDSGSHLLNLINNLLDLSKAEAGKFKLQKTHLNLSALVANIVAYFRHQGELAGVALELKSAIEESVILADENAIRQICYNLLSNALKFTPRGGSVTVKIDHAGNDMVTIAVLDSGIGMDSDAVEMALQPFGQVENAFNRKYAGTGLGLPLVSSLCELHGGEFRISSRPGVGTECLVSLSVQ